VRKSGQAYGLKEDMESFGLSREDAQVRNKFEERNRAGKNLETGG